jgi:hypothetical protein
VNAEQPIPAFHKLQVDKPYIPGRTSWPAGPEYNFRAGTHELRLFFDNLSNREVLDVRRAPAQFGLYVEDPLIVLLYRFGSVGWGDAPYSWWIVPEGQRTLPDTTGFTEPHALMNVILIEATNGLVRALRFVSLSPAFTTALHLVIAEQAAMPPLEPAAYHAAVDAYQRRYPDPTALLPLTRARTDGGR